mmetsp:Transcript_646/g.1209  ORF Transcript_646/g.1209 Transcript_646/m.1209 type:complete len:227 (+) Transcript_646:1753-2433(+)
MCRRNLLLGVWILGVLLRRRRVTSRGFWGTCERRSSRCGGTIILSRGETVLLLLRRWSARIRWGGPRSRESKELTTWIRSSRSTVTRCVRWSRKCCNRGWSRGLIKEIEQVGFAVLLRSTGSSTGSSSSFFQRHFDCFSKVCFLLFLVFWGFQRSNVVATRSSSCHASWSHIESSTSIIFFSNTISGSRCNTSWVIGSQSKSKYFGKVKETLAIDKEIILTKSRLD